MRVKEIKTRILLGICGGIAAYKCAELIRLLRKQNYEVRVVMTVTAQQFITPLTCQALSQNPVALDLFDLGQESTMGHIDLARWADRILIAPATADLIAKMAAGLADDLLSTLLLAAECPIDLAPAMNQAMWRNPATQRNVKALSAQGVGIIGPECGDQACGEVGPGRMSEPEQIVQTLFPPVPKLLAGLRLVISAGPTREAIDPVRYLTNRSSGKMGYALAEAAVEMDADVVLVSGPVQLLSPQGCMLVAVESALEMRDAVLTHTKTCDIYIGTAAVADYRVAQVSAQKIKKTQTLTLELTQNPDIIREVASLSPKPFVVGFAAETDELAHYAQNKLNEKRLDMVAANWVGGHEGGFESDLNALELFWQGGHQSLPLMSKRELAKQLLTLIAQHRHDQRST